MSTLLNIMSLLLKQNETEKRLTSLSFMFLAIVLLILIIDCVAKGRWVPKSGAVRAIIVLAFILVLGFLILKEIYYK